MTSGEGWRGGEGGEGRVVGVRSCWCGEGAGGVFVPAEGDGEHAAPLVELVAEGFDGLKARAAARGGRGVVARGESGTAGAWGCW